MRFCYHWTMTRIQTALLGLTLLMAACRPSTGAPPSPAQTDAPSLEPTAIPSRIPVTPTLTATLAPAPRFFTEQFGGSLPYWAFLQIDNGQPATGPSAEGGFLVFDLSAPNQWVYALYGGPDYEDVRLDAQVEVRSGRDGAIGLVCRYSEKDGWYELNVYADQTYELLFGQWLTQDVARYTPIYRGNSEKIKSDANEIGLLCEGDTLTPFINGVQLRKWQDRKYALKRGKIGISAASFEDVPFMSAYDWGKVSEP